MQPLSAECGGRNHRRRGFIYAKVTTDRRIVTPVAQSLWDFLCVGASVFRWRFDVAVLAVFEIEAVCTSSAVVWQVWILDECVVFHEDVFGVSCDEEAFVLEFEEVVGDSDVGVIRSFAFQDVGSDGDCGAACVGSVDEAVFGDGQVVDGTAFEPVVGVARKVQRGIHVVERGRCDECFFAC